MVPPAIAELIKVIIGVPGAILWIGGGVCTVHFGIFALLKHREATLGTLGILGMSIGSAMVGYLMVVASEVMSTRSRYRIAGKHLPKLVTLELGLQASCVIAACTATAWLGFMATNGSPLAFACVVMMCLAAYSVIVIQHRLKLALKDWQQEFAEIEPIYSGPGKETAEER